MVITIVYTMVYNENFKLLVIFFIEHDDFESFLLNLGNLMDELYLKFKKYDHILCGEFNFFSVKILSR